MINMLCHSPNRNYRISNGKNAALFIDIDGTFQVCQIYFDQATENFVHYMKLRGFDPSEAKTLLKKIDKEKTEAEGFERDRFGRSLIACYDELRIQKRRRFRQKDIFCDRQICEQIGNWPFFREPQMYPYAAAVMGRAYHSFMMFAVSMGNREAQKFKIRHTGLSTIFDDLIVTSRDDKAEIVKQVIEDCNIDPAMSAFVGNSRRSDGACLQHTNFCYLPLEAGWEFDHAKALPENSNYKVYNVRDWREAEEKVFNSLLRRRRTQASMLPVSNQDTDSRSGQDNSSDMSSLSTEPDNCCGK